MQYINSILLAVAFIICLSAAPKGAPLLGPNDEDYEILVNNRVLTTIHKNPITVMDVMKQMDLVFYNQYPQYSSSKIARHQFYNMQWKQYLSNIIDKELILADAEQSKIEVTNGDIRKEIEMSFGPNVIENLDKVGLTMEEAWDMVRSEILVRRIMMAKVNMKAMSKASPQHIREAYSEYAEDHVLPEKWVYRVVTIRDKDPVHGAEVAQNVMEHLKEQQVDFEQLKATLAEDPPEGATITVSDEFESPSEEISSNYKQVLATLSEGTFSDPVVQEGRKDLTILHRIFYLKEIKKEGAPPLNTVADLLRSKLLDTAIGKETDRYVQYLRHRFGFDDNHVLQNLPSEFQPFVLQQK